MRFQAKIISTECTVISELGTVLNHGENRTHRKNSEIFKVRQLEKAFPLQMREL